MNPEQYAQFLAMQNANPFGRAGLPQFPMDMTIPGMGPLGQMAGMVASSNVFNWANVYPGRFSPSGRSYYDDAKGRNYYNNLLEIQGGVASKDSRAIGDVMRGIAGSLGIKQDAGFDAAVEGGTRKFQEALPYLAQSMPGVASSIFGRRGSATLMAAHIQAAGQRLRDPVTGASSYSADSTTRISRTIADDITGPRDENLNAMRGIKLDEYGDMMAQMSSRGLIGHKDATLTDKLTELAKSPAHADYRDMLEAVGGKQFASDAIGGRNGGLGDVTGDPDKLKKAAAWLKNKPDVDGRILQDLEGHNTSKKLKDMTGAVVAMKEIFGDSGKTGSMDELLTSLDELTQGGLSRMTPQALETTARLTQAAGSVSGLGFEGMMALSARGAGLADAMGVDRHFVPGVSIDAAAASRAYGEGPGGGTALSGLNKVGMMLATQTLATSGLRSGATKQRATLYELGQSRLDAGQKLDKGYTNMMAAIKAGDDEFINSRGRKQSISGMTDVDRDRMLSAIGSDPFEFGIGVRNDTGIEDTINGRGLEGGMKKANQVGQRAEFRRFGIDKIQGVVPERLAAGAMDTLLGLTTKQQGTDTERRGALVDYFKKQGLGVNAAVRAANNADSTFMRAVKTSPFFDGKSGVAWLQMLNPENQARQEAARQTIGAQAAVREGLGGIGTDALARVFEILRKPGAAKADIAKALGGIDRPRIDDALKALDATSDADAAKKGTTPAEIRKETDALRKGLNAAQAGKALDKDGDLDKKLREFIEDPEKALKKLAGDGDDKHDKDMGRVDRGPMRIIGKLEIIKNVANLIDASIEDNSAATVA